MTDDLKNKINEILDSHAAHVLGHEGLTKTEAMQKIVEAIESTEPNYKKNYRGIE